MINIEDLPPSTFSALAELVARWHRANEHKDRDDSFTAGRMAGYVQAIQLIMGMRDFATVEQSLKEDLL